MTSASPAAAAAAAAATGSGTAEADPKIPAEGEGSPGAPKSGASEASRFVSMDALDDVHRLGSADRVSYRVVEDKEEARALVVTDAGELEIPYLGRIKAADKTCRQLAREVEAALEKDLYYQATVIVAIDLLNKKRGTVYLVGQVRNPGAMELPSDETLTVSKAILRAGGFGEFANRRRVRVTRGAGSAQGKGEGMPIVVDVDRILEEGRAEKDFKLEPGDLILVPSRLLNF